MNQINYPISLNEFCSVLGISVATGRNWIRLGKLVPQDMIKNTAYFSEEYVTAFQKSLKDGNNTALRSRRNKSFVTGSNLYSSYVSETSIAQQHVQTLLNYIQKNNVIIDEERIQILVAECAAQLLLHDTIFSYAGNCLYYYLKGSLHLNGYEYLIDDLVGNRESALAFIEEYPELFSITYQYEGNEDVLGLLYISTKNLGKRKATGSYYTPTKVVKNLCQKIFEKNEIDGKLFLDPCCGTGNFLLQLPKQIPFENIYGNDTDLLSVKICRINLAIKYAIRNQELLFSHITCTDYMNHEYPCKFDFILGNPPWGYQFTEEEKEVLREKYQTASGVSVESFHIFIEQAFRDLNPDGVLSFVLPESFLNVKSHTQIRTFLAARSSFQYLAFLGNAFDGVNCPCVILQTRYTNDNPSCIGMEVSQADRSFVIASERKMDPSCFYFQTTDEEYALINKIRDWGNKVYLADHADFALGIVTGNNQEYITNEKTENNELILKGSDICKYKYKPSGNYITFQPEVFQQVAPVECYRAPEKLFYRFISNQLVFAYDCKQTLSLNSCNILIPHIDELDMKYILAVLNSRVLQFYFQKSFHSVKVLRSHIEQLPIAFPSAEEQTDVLTYVEQLLTSSDSASSAEIYNQLDRTIAKLYQLTEEEYQLICLT